MALPTLSASLNKTTYAPGETMTLTVTYADADNRSASVTVTGTDGAGNPASVSLNFNISDAVTVAATGGATWTKVSDNGSVAVFTATA